MGSKILRFKNKSGGVRSFTIPQKFEGQKLGALSITADPGEAIDLDEEALKHILVTPAAAAMLEADFEPDDGSSRMGRIIGVSRPEMFRPSAKLEAMIEKAARLASAGDDAQRLGVERGDDGVSRVSVGSGVREKASQAGPKGPGGPARRGERPAELDRSGGASGSDMAPINAGKLKPIDPDSIVAGAVEPKA